MAWIWSTVICIFELRINYLIEEVIICQDPSRAVSDTITNLNGLYYLPLAECHQPDWPWNIDPLDSFTDRHSHRIGFPFPVFMYFMAVWLLWHMHFIQVFAELKDLADEVISAELVSPTLIIIGKVVALSPSWPYSSKEVSCL